MTNNYNYNYLDCASAHELSGCCSGQHARLLIVEFTCANILDARVVM